MKFPWIVVGGAGSTAKPWVPCGVRHSRVALRVAILAILDTGADTTVLPFAIASMMGFSTSDLASIDTLAVGGTVKLWKPTADPKVDLQIGGQWVRLPAVLFAENTPPLLGRDVIFSNFDLRMCDGETELLPRTRR